MKKILACLGAAAIVSTGASSVIACDNGKKTVANLTEVNFSNFSGLVIKPNLSYAQITKTIVKKAAFDVADYMKVEVSDTAEMKTITSQISIDSLKYYDATNKEVPFPPNGSLTQKDFNYHMVAVFKANGTVVKGTSDAVDFYSEVNLSKIKASGQGFPLNLTVSGNQKLANAKALLIKAALADKLNEKLLAHVDAKTLIANMYVQSGQDKREMMNDQDIKQLTSSDKVFVVFSKASGWDFAIDNSAQLKVALKLPSGVDGHRG